MNETPSDRVTVNGPPGAVGGKLSPAAMKLSRKAFRCAVDALVGSDPMRRRQQFAAGTNSVYHSYPLSGHERRPVVARRDTSGAGHLPPEAGLRCAARDQHRRQILVATNGELGTGALVDDGECRRAAEREGGRRRRPVDCRNDAECESCRRSPEGRRSPRSIASSRPFSKRGPDAGPVARSVHAVNITSADEAETRREAAETHGNSGTGRALISGGAQRRKSAEPWFDRVRTRTVFLTAEDAEVRRGLQLLIAFPKALAVNVPLRTPASSAVKKPQVDPIRRPYHSGKSMRRVRLSSRVSARKTSSFALTSSSTSQGSRNS